jgi:hypothetical protein
MIKNFCKMALDSNGTIVNMLLPSFKTQGLALTNPSIYFDGEKLHCNLRYVEYALFHSENEQKFQNQWGVLSYLHPEDDLKLRTKNAYTSDYGNVDFEFIDTSLLDVEPMWEFVGLEDARIVVWEGKTYLCGVRRDTTTNGVGRMELSEIVDGKEVNRYRIEPPQGYTYCEKNWMPVVDMPFHFVKWTNPTEVVKVNIETLTSETIVNSMQPLASKLERDIRGGSQVISYKEYYIALVHEVKLWHNEKSNKDGQYYHRFVVWDKEWNIVHLSEDFKFFGANIEFSCGMVFANDNFHISFGFQDSSSYLLSVPADFIEYFIGFSNEKPKVQKEENTTFDLFSYYAENTEDGKANLNIGYQFYQLGHFASAMGFFIRSAEFSKDDNITYEALIFVSKCLANLGRRKESEKTAMLNAIAFAPLRYEAYFYMSQYYEPLQDYFMCHLMAQLAVTHYTDEHNLLYLEKIEWYKAHFQLGYTSWWVGKFKDSRKIMFELAENYKDGNYDPVYKNLIQNNITRLGSGDEFTLYNKEDLNSYRFKFDGVDEIVNNFSQCYQDMFIMSILEGKKNGTYLEIGSADPFKGNNSFLLEHNFGWEGKGIEILAHEVEKYNKVRKNKAILKNALQVDYDDLLSEMANYHQNDNCFDYLQVDCEPPSVSFEILKMIPFDKFKFAVITFEHDYYADLEKTIRDESRTYLESKGYVLVIGNVSMNDFCPYEDWWVHPDLVSQEKIAQMLNDKESVVNIKKFMLGYNKK